MSRGALFAVLAAGLLISGSLSAQDAPGQTPAAEQNAESTREQSSAQGDDQPVPEYQYAPELIGAINRIDAAIRSLAVEADQRRSDAAEQREISDLQAQQQMAWWTLWIFVATATAVVLTGIGVLLIWRTLYHTRRAADFTKGMLTEAEKTTAAAMRATEAAERQIDVSRAAMIAEQRAWMKISEIRWTSGLKRVNGAFSISFLVKAKNIGKTPARSCDLDISVGPAQWPLGFGTGSSIWKEPEVDSRFGSVVFPADEITQEFESAISIEDINKLLEISNEKRWSYLEVHISCVYNTVFDDEKHMTVRRFNMRRRGPSDAPGLLSFIAPEERNIEMADLVEVPGGMNNEYAD
jgi:hypothetical protein